MGKCLGLLEARLVEFEYAEGGQKGEAASLMSLVSDTRVKDVCAYVCERRRMLNTHKKKAEIHCWSTLNLLTGKEDFP